MTPNAGRLVLKLLLGADDVPLSARDAIAACGLFGIRENSVRVALVRLSAAGMIEAEGRGTYRIGPSATGLAEEVRAWREAEARVRPWSGAWVAVHTGGLGRTDRVELRQRDRALLMLGFRELERGLAVRPDNLAGGAPAARARLGNLGLDEQAAVFRVSDFDPARDARARSLWKGKELTKGYLKWTARLEKWLARSSRLDLDAAARESFLLGDDAIRHLVFDPLLPEPLVDVAARRAFVDAVTSFDRAGHEIWRRLRSSDPRGASEGLAAILPPTARNA